MSTMLDYFTDDGHIHQFDDRRTDLSYQEIYRIYEPSQSMLRTALRTQRAVRQRIFEARESVRNSLVATVPLKDVDTVTTLVGSILWLKSLAHLEELISMNQGLLRLQTNKSRAAEVIAIPITDFMQFNRGGWARCPFHGDKQPSLKYYKRDNRVHCFAGCGQKNVIQVYAHIKSIDTREAFKQLAASLI